MESEYLERIVGGSRRKSTTKKHTRKVKGCGAHTHKVKPMGVLTKTKMKSHMLKMLKGHGVHPHVLKHLNGMGFWGNLWDGLKQVGSTVVGLAKKAAPHVRGVLPHLKKFKGLEKYAVGAEKILDHPVAKAIGLGRRRTVKRKTAGARSGGASSGGARSKRAAIVKRVMKAEGLTLPEASKYVKVNGLY
jgi:transposase-like protein